MSNPRYDVLRGVIMKTYAFIWLFLLVFLVACTQTKIEEELPPVVINEPPPVVVVPPEPVMPAFAPGYMGKLLAGTKSYYLEYTKTDYDKAITENKLILLNFYSSTCTYCVSDNDGAIAAYNTMNFDDVIGFRVDFNDDNMDLEEKNIALKYGIANWNTKVIIRDGERVFKSVDTWNRDRFITELERNRG